MAQHHQTTMEYECDYCGTVLVLDGVVGGPLGGPANWKTVTPQTTTNGDWFCSWGCLGRWALDQEAKREAKIAALAARAEVPVEGA